MTSNADDLQKVLGPLWELYDNDEIHEIFVDAYDDIYYEENGEIKNSSNTFKNSIQVVQLIKSLCVIAGRDEKENNCSLNFTLTSGIQVIAILPPLSVSAPLLYFAKPPKEIVSWNDLVKWGAIDGKGIELIKSFIKNNCNILVAGNIGSGKTTIANLLLDTIPKAYRVVTIEKSVGLVTNRKRTARLQTINQQDEELVELVQIASRMRADYIVLNEIQGIEAMSFMELLRDGHSGIGVIGAENIFDSIKRLEFKALTSNFGGNIEDIRYSISQAFDYVQERKEDGSRILSKIGKIEFENNELKLDIIYKFE